MPASVPGLTYFTRKADCAQQDFPCEIQRRLPGLVPLLSRSTPKPARMGLPVWACPYGPARMGVVCLGVQDAEDPQQPAENVSWAACPHGSRPRVAWARRTPPYGSCPRACLSLRENRRRDACGTRPYGRHEKQPFSTGLAADVVANTATTAPIHGPSWIEIVIRDSGSIRHSGLVIRHCSEPLVRHLSPLSSRNVYSHCHLTSLPGSALIATNGSGQIEWSSA